MTRIISLLVVLMLCLVCTNYEDNNPYDKEYEGNYFLEVAWDSIPALLGCFITYRVPYTHSSGNDSLNIFSPVDTLGAIIDNSLFNIYPSSYFDLYFTKEYSGQIVIQGKALNGKIAGDSISVVIVDPFNISTGSTIEFGKEITCSLAVDSLFITSFVKDSADSVIWENNTGKKDTIPVTEPFTFRVENHDSCKVTACFWDRRYNKGKAISQSYPVAQIAPVVMFDDTADTIVHRVGPVPIPVSFSDANDPVDSIFCLFQDSLRSDIVKYSDWDTLILETDNIEIIDSVYIWVKDSSGLSSNKQAKVLRTFIPDDQPPYVRKYTPAEDTIITAYDSLVITLLAWDNYGVRHAACSTGNSVFQGDLDTTINDSTFWQVTVTGYSFQDYYKVTPYAEDSFYISANGSPFYIYYDSTLIDSTPPEITIISPSDNSRDSTGSGTVQVKVKDIVSGKDFVDDGIDTVYYLVNGSFADTAVKLNDSLYSFSYTLPIYHWNTIAVIAQDSSGNKNIDTAILHINYNTVPDSFSLLLPPSDTVNVENIGGVTFSWNHAQDADGDTVTYSLYYGTDTSNLLLHTTIDTSYPVTTLQGYKTYYWRVKAATSLDELFNSIDSGTYYTFTTRDHPAVITGFSDTTVTINDFIPFSISATDHEGILEYRWDWNGDGACEDTTNDPAKTYAYDTEKTYNPIVTVVDSNSQSTTDTAVVTVTDYAPSIDADTSDSNKIYVGYRDSIYLVPVATDDGKIVKYEWSFDGMDFIDFTNSLGCTTRLADTADLPDTLTYVFRVTDEDGRESKDSLSVIVNMKWDSVENVSWILNRTNFPVVFDDNEMFVLGGRRGTPQRDVWKTVDGNTWFKISEDSSFTPRYRHSATIKNDTLYVAGGDLTHDVWRSLDNGVTWDSVSNLIDVDLNYIKLIGSELISLHDTTIYLIGGNDGNAATNKVYSSRDGVTWDSLDLYANSPGDRFSASDNFSTFVKGDTAWAFVNKEIWHSDPIPLGDLWSMDTTINDVEGRGNIMIYGNNMYAVSDSSLWFIEERGKRWYKLTSLGPWAGSTYIRTAVFNNKLWVFTDKGMWFSTDVP